MIKVVAAKLTGSCTVEALEELIKTLPNFEETPLLDGCVLVLNKPDRYSLTEFTLAKVTRVQKVELEQVPEIVWIIGIIVVMDYVWHYNIYYKSETDYVQLFKDKSNRYNLIPPPGAVDQPPDEHFDPDFCNIAEEPWPAQEEPESGRDDFV